MTDTWTWATVTQATPLRIKVDGDTTPLDATTGDLVGSLAVDDRVRVHLHSDGIIVTGIQGGGNRSNPNLLINSNFMVNQEGAVSGASVSQWQYFLDQWQHGSFSTSPATTWADSGGVRTLTIGGVGNARAIRQPVEAANAPSGTYTLSWEGTASGRVYNAGAGPSWSASPVTVTLNGTADVYVEFVGSGDTLRNVKLEQAAVATPYQPPKYDDNLRACMRYYQRFGGAVALRFGNGFYASNSEFRAYVPLLVPMRTTLQTVTYGGLNVYDGSADLAVSALVAGYPNMNIAWLRATVSGGTQFRPGELYCNSSASFVALDARL